MKNILKIISFSGAVIAPLTIAPITMAAGFQLNEFSVSSMGRAHAGETAMYDNAGAIARNPAALGMFEKQAFSVVLHYIDPDVNVKGTVGASKSTQATLAGYEGTGPGQLPVGTSQAFAASVPTVDASKDDVAPDAIVPGFYYANPINDKWAVGLAINSHFGMSTDYGSGYAGSEFAGKTEITTYYVTPSVSFKPIDSLSLGLGLSYIYGEGKIKNSASASVAQATQFLSAIPPLGVSTVPQGTTLLSVDGDGDAFGWQVGLLWKITDQTRVGVRYESQVDMEFEGDITYLPKTGTLERSGKLTIDLPEVFEIGLVQEVGDNWLVMVGAQMTGWSSFENLTGEIKGVPGDVLLKDEQWDDAWRYSIGAETKLNEMTTLRFGYALDESPVDDKYRTLTIPDADRNWYTFGATFDLQNSSKIDVSLIYIDGDSVEVHEVSSAGTEFNGELSSTNVYIVSIGYNYSF